MIEAENDSHLEQSVERQRWQVSTSVDSGHAACPTAEGPPPPNPRSKPGHLWERLGGTLSSFPAPQIRFCFIGGKKKEGGF